MEKVRICNVYKKYKCLQETEIKLDNLRFSKKNVKMILFSVKVLMLKKEKL